MSRTPEHLPEFDIPSPESSDPKEVYAFFGLAAYWAQVLEREVINFTVAVHMETKSHLSRVVVEDLWRHFEVKTFGTVLRAARRITSIPPEMDGLLGTALAMRNHLVHGFFWERAEWFLSDVGRTRMMVDLQDHMKVFKRANDELEPLTLRLLGQFDVSREILDRHLQEMLARAQAEDAHGAP
jgi:hypothetical protein